MNWKAIELAVPELQGDAQIVYAAACNNVQSLGFASAELLDNHAFMHPIVKLHWKGIRYCSEAVRGHKDIVLSGVKQNWLAIQSAGPLLQKDRDFMILAMQTNREVIPYGTEHFHEDREFWVMLVKLFPDGVSLFLQHYGEGELQNCSALMHELTKRDWRAFQIASEQLRGKQSLQLEAVCQCWEAVKFANNVDLKVMKECVSQQWRSIELFLAEDGPRANGFITRDDRVVLASCNPHIIRAPQLADDDLTVMAAVEKEGPVLEFASERLRADRATATTAIRQNWKALKFASHHLRGDRGLIMETLKQCGLALQFATDEMRCDHGVVIEAVVRHRKALPYLSPKLYDDKLFWTKVCRRFPDGYKMAMKYGMNDLPFMAGAQAA